MDCLGMVRSGNYAFKLCNILERKGYVFEVISTPCIIAKGGCGYCIKFPEQYMNMVINEGAANGIHILEVYRIIPGFSKNRYERIY